MKLIMKQIRQNVENLIEAKAADNKYEFRIIKACLVTALRKWHDYEDPIFISEKAKEKADELGVDLWVQRWTHQYKFDKGRKIFIMEHKYPINDMILDMMADPDNIEHIFNSGEFGWILKTEDALLKSHNRICHDTAYEEANIRLIKNE